MPRTPKYTDNAQRQRAYRERKNRALRNTQALREDRQLLTIDRPALRYMGGKWRIARWIIDQFPPHKCYVEPFMGGASVLLQKAPAPFEVLNDLNHDVVNFFDVLRSAPEELIRAIRLTPYSREELRRARTEPGHDHVDRARKFYVRCWQSFGSGTGTSSTGWRFQIGDGENSRASAVRSFNDTEHLWNVAARLKLVQIECDDAYSVIQHYDGSETLFYLDYPYVHSTRYHTSKSKGYSHEMTDEDHRRFAHLACTVKGHVIVSGYPSALYDELYAGWKVLTRETTDLIGGNQTECIWLSPSIMRINTLPLFTALDYANAQQCD